MNIGTYWKHVIILLATSWQHCFLHFFLRLQGEQCSFGTCMVLNEGQYEIETTMRLYISYTKRNPCCTIHRSGVYAFAMSFCMKSRFPLPESSVLPSHPLCSLGTGFRRDPSGVASHSRKLKSVPKWKQRLCRYFLNRHLNCGDFETEWLGLVRATEQHIVGPLLNSGAAYSSITRPGPLPSADGLTFPPPFKRIIDFVRGPHARSWLLKHAQSPRWIRGDLAAGPCPDVTIAQIRLKANITCPLVHFNILWYV